MGEEPDRYPSRGGTSPIALQKGFSNLHVYTMRILLGYRFRFQKSGWD